MLEQEVLPKVQEIAAKINFQLLERLNSLDKTKTATHKSFPPEYADLLSTIPKDSAIHNMLTTLLSSLLMLDEINFEADRAEKVVLGCYENMSHLLENFTLMQKVLYQNDKNLVRKAFRYSYEHLSCLITNLHQYPVSVRNTVKKDTFIQRHISILEESKDTKLNLSQEVAAVEDQNTVSDQDYIKQLQQDNEQLVSSNEELKVSLSRAEKELIQLQIKLMHILNERDEETGENSQREVPVEYQEELRRARIEIERMNEQFCIEINKYNEVFRSMEAEIAELRNNAQADIIQELETEIVRLREERERDELIILQMKEREMAREMARENYGARAAMVGNNGGRPSARNRGYQGYS